MKLRRVIKTYEVIEVPCADYLKHLLLEFRIYNDIDEIYLYKKHLYNHGSMEKFAILRMNDITKQDLDQLYKLDSYTDKDEVVNLLAKYEQQIFGNDQPIVGEYYV